MNAPWPAEVAGLPVCPHRRLPVPFAATRRPDGVAEFTVIDPVRVRACAAHRLCGVCGLALGYWVAFFGGPASADPARGAYTDPPMHEGCVEAAIGLCPFISKPRVPRRSPPVDIIAADPAGFLEGGKGEGRGWVMVICRGYRVVTQPTRQGGVAEVFRPLQVARTRTFNYGPDGVLRELTAPARPARAVVRTQRRKGGRRG